MWVTTPAAAAVATDGSRSRWASRAAGRARGSVAARLAPRHADPPLGGSRARRRAPPTPATRSNTAVKVEPPRLTRAPWKASTHSRPNAMLIVKPGHHEEQQPAPRVGRPEQRDHRRLARRRAQAADQAQREHFEAHAARMMIGWCGPVSRRAPAATSSGREARQRRRPRRTRSTPAVPPVAPSRRRAPAPTCARPAAPRSRRRAQRGADRAQRVAALGRERTLGRALALARIEAEADSGETRLPAPRLRRSMAASSPVSAS